MVFGAAARAVFALVNRYVPWYRLPVRLGLLNLEAFRYVLRAREPVRHASSGRPRRARGRCRPPPPGEQVRVARTLDGTSNDLSAPGMGAVGSAFGRNLRPDFRPDLFDEPNPVVVSQQLLHREQFLPARSLNLLAAAWIQFQVHDWVSHARHPLGEDDVVVPLPGGHDVVEHPGRRRRSTRCGSPGTSRYPDERPNRMSPVFANDTSPWWDGSEVYGADADKAGQLREGAKLRLDPGRIPARRRQRASRSPASTRAGGSGSAACTRCSRASTTCCATSSARTTTTGATSASTRRRG